MPHSSLCLIEKFMKLLVASRGVLSRQTRRIAVRPNPATNDLEESTDASPGSWRCGRYKNFPREDHAEPIMCDIDVRIMLVVNVCLFVCVCFWFVFPVGRCISLRVSLAL